MKMCDSCPAYRPVFRDQNPFEIRAESASGEARGGGGLGPGMTKPAKENPVAMGVVAAGNFRDSKAKVFITISCHYFHAHFASRGRQIICIHGPFAGRSENDCQTTY
jgi:hypothetical protein